MFSSAKGAVPYELAWEEVVCNAVRQLDVRYICGVFWQGKDDTASLFKKLRACGGGFFFQSFWCEDTYKRCRDAETAAVAARFDMLPDNVKVHFRVPRILVGAWPVAGGQ